jgi:hypothetical protein
MDLFGTGGAQRRRLKTGLLMGTGTALALSVLAITPARAADSNAALKAQIDALTAQVNALVAHDQAQTTQLKALNDQLQQLKAAPAPAAGPLVFTAPGALPTFDQANVAVTQSPGNVPGRSGYAPESSNGPNPKLGPAAGTAPFTGEVGTNPVGAGNPSVKLSLSGQVDREVLYGDDGHASEFRNLDNNISSTRFRFQGESWINSNTSAGANIELEIRPNSSSNTGLTPDGSNSVTNFTGGIPNVGSTTGAPSSNTTGTPTVRWAEIFFTNTDYGAVHLGFGGTSGYLTNENDLSGTFYAGYENVSDTDGGLSFRQSSAAVHLPGAANARTGVPAGAGNTFISSPAGAFGPAVGSVFFYMDGLVRNDRIRYDSPTWNGFQLSTSAIDGGAYDVALRYGGDWYGTQVQAGAAISLATSLNHAAPNAYGYSSGVPTAASALVGQGSTPPIITGPSAAGSTQYNGSFSILHPTGLNLTVAGGYQDVIYQDPLHQNLSPDLIYVKAGWKTPTPFFSFGPTAFALSFAENDDLLYHGDHAKDFGVLFEQEVSPAAASLYVSYHHQELDREFGSYAPIDLVTAGGIVRF